MKNLKIITNKCPKDGGELNIYCLDCREKICEVCLIKYLENILINYILILLLDFFMLLIITKLKTKEEK